MDASNPPKSILCFLEGIQPSLRSKKKEAIATFDRNFETISNDITLEDATLCFIGHLDQLKPLPSNITQATLLNNIHLEYNSQKRYINIRKYKHGLIHLCGIQEVSFFGKVKGFRRSAIISIKVLSRLINQNTNPQSFQLFQHAIQLFGLQQFEQEIRFTDHEAAVTTCNDPQYQQSVVIIREVLTFLRQNPYSSTISQAPSAAIEQSKAQMGTLTTQLTTSNKVVRVPPHLKQQQSTDSPSSVSSSPQPHSEQIHDQTTKQNSNNGDDGDDDAFIVDEIDSGIVVNRDDDNDDDDWERIPSNFTMDNPTSPTSPISPQTRQQPSSTTTATTTTTTTTTMKSSTTSTSNQQQQQQQQHQQQQQQQQQSPEKEKEKKKMFSKFRDMLSSKQDYQSLRKQTIVQDGILFGRSLQDLVQDEMCDEISQVPLFLIIIVEYLLSDDSLSEREGIFRVAGNIQKVLQLKQSLDFNHFFNPRDWDVLDLCNLIKIWLRELPDPLIPHTLLPPLVEAYQSGDEELVFSLINSADFPIANRATMHYLLRIGAHITSPRFKKFNQMSTQSLCVVLMPNMIRPRPGKMNDLVQTQSDMSSAVAILMLLMESVRADLPQDGSSIATDVTYLASHKMNQQSTNSQHQGVTVAETGMVVADLSLDEIQDMNIAYLNQNNQSPIINDNNDNNVNENNNHITNNNDGDNNNNNNNNQDVNTNTNGDNRSDRIIKQRQSSQVPPMRRGSLLDNDSQFRYRGHSVVSYQSRPSIAVSPTDELPVHSVVIQPNTKAELQLIKDGLEQAGEQQTNNNQRQQVFREANHVVDVQRDVEIYSSSTTSTSSNTTGTTTTTTTTQQQQQQQHGRQRGNNNQDQFPPPPPSTQTNSAIQVNMKTALDTVPEFQKKKLESLALPAVPVPVEDRPLPLRPDQVQNLLLAEKERRSSILDSHPPSFNHPNHSGSSLLPPNNNSNHSINIPPTSSNQLPPSTSNDHPLSTAATAATTTTTTTTATPSSSIAPPQSNNQTDQVQAYYALPRGHHHRMSITDSDQRHINPLRSASQTPIRIPNGSSISILSSSPPPATTTLPTTSSSSSTTTTATTTTTTTPPTTTPPTTSTTISNSSSLTNSQLFSTNASSSFAIGRKVGKKNYYVPGKSNQPTNAGGLTSHFSSNNHPQSFPNISQPPLQLPPTPKNTTQTSPEVGLGNSRFRVNTARRNQPNSNTTATPPPPNNNNNNNNYPSSPTPPTLNRPKSPTSNTSTTMQSSLSSSPTTSSMNSLKELPPPINIQNDTDDYDPDEAHDQSSQLFVPQQIPAMTPTKQFFKPVSIRGSVSYDLTTNRIISDSVQDDPLVISTSMASLNDTSIDDALLPTNASTPTLKKHLSTSPRTVNTNNNTFFSPDIVANSTGIDVETIIERTRGQSFLPPQDENSLCLNWEEFFEVDGSSYFFHTPSGVVSKIRPCWANRDKIKLVPSPPTNP